MKVVLLITSLCCVFPFYGFQFYAGKKQPELQTSSYAIASEMIAEGFTLLQDGDLVVRLNQDPTSLFIKNMNRSDKSFSHSGIVLFDNGYPYVYHILSGEENDSGKLSMDSLSHFADPRKNMGYGIYRYDLNSSELKKLKQIMGDWFEKEIQFDSSFNLKTDELMYCSEMIKKGIEFSTNNRIQIQTTKPTSLEIFAASTFLKQPVTSVENIKIVAIDNLYINPHCKEIKRFSFY